MLQTTQSTYVVSSTDLKRKYHEVREILRRNQLVIVVNRNSDAPADGIFIPYSEAVVEKLEDLLEDIEMQANRTALEKEFETSAKSGKGKRIPLDKI